MNAINDFFQIMNYKDYYSTLGVVKNASRDEIKKAYRRLARKHHPDVNPDDDTAAHTFKEISEAYEVLGNEENRKLYDQLGADWKRYKQAGGQQADFNWQNWARTQGARTQGARTGQHTHSRSTRDFFGGGDFSEFFDQVFGGGFHPEQHGQRHTRSGPDFRGKPFGNPAASVSQKGKDIHAELEITLKEAYKGTEKSVRVNKKQMKIKIPGGIHDGRRLKLKGRGSPGIRGGETGDLYIRIRVRPHERFVREEEHLHTTTNVGLYQMVLGGVVQVPTMTGKVKIKVPPESQPGKVMRLAGYGMPVFQSENRKGDLFVTLQVTLPEKLGNEEKKLFQELAARRSEDVSGS